MRPSNSCPLPIPPILRMSSASMLLFFLFLLPTHQYMKRYRRMLLTTLHTATHRLGERPAAPVNLASAYNVTINTMTNIHFACKVLAVLYWRLPPVGAAISQILEIPNLELLAPVLSFSPFPDDSASNASELVSSTNSFSSSSTSSSSSTPANTSITIDNTTTSQLINQPTPRSRPGSSLYGWPQVYKDLPPLTDPIVLPPQPLPLSSSTPSPSSTSLSTTPPATPALSNPPSPSPSAWLTVLAKFDVTYYLFFKEWILHVKYVPKLFLSRFSLICSFI